MTNAKKAGIDQVANGRYEGSNLAPNQPDNAPIRKQRAKTAKRKHGIRYGYFDSPSNTHMQITPPPAAN